MLQLITFVQARLAGLRNDEDGATAVEYALMVSGITLAVITAVLAIGTFTDGKFDLIKW